MKTLKKLVVGNPEKKGKTALKPPNALTAPAARRMQFSELLAPPPTRRVALAAVLVVIGLALWGVADLVPGSTTAWSTIPARIRRCASDNGYRAQPKRGETDELSTLYATLAVGLAGPEHEAFARSRLAGRETLWDVAAACLELKENSAAQATCRIRLQTYIVQANNSEGPIAYLADKGREPQLRSALLGAEALHAVGGSLPSTEIAAWVSGLQQDDGGFPGQRGLPPSLMATWRAVQLLQLVDGLTEEISSKAAQFAKSCQALDGGFSDRPQSLLERAQRHAESAVVPSLRGAHLLLLLGADAKSAVRFVLHAPLNSVSALYHAHLVDEALPSFLPVSVTHPWVASILRSAGLLAALLIAPHVYAGLYYPSGEPAVLAACLVGASLSFEAGVGVLAVGLTAVSLLLALHLVFLRIPLNDTGEELLYVSIASAAGSAGLFFALGYTSADVFTNVISLYVFVLWAPLCSYLSVYVACMFMTRANTYFVASTYAAWLIVLFLIPFLLHRRNMLEIVVRLLLLKGHFSPAVAASSAVTLFASHAAALVANSV